jgi:DNA polymerase III subunit epsilon
MGGLLRAYRNKLKRKIPEQKDMHPSALRYLKAVRQIAENTSIGEATYIVFDTELTGLNIKKDSVVSIGALKMRGGKIDFNEIYYRVINPEAQMTRQSVVIHEITPSEASLCPKIDLILPEFLEFCRDGIIVGHFVSIDIAFVSKEMIKLFGFSLQNPAIDTQKLYKWIRLREEQPCAFHAGLSEDLDLFSLANRYSISSSNAHNALDDAFVTAQLFQRFINRLMTFNVNTVKELVSIGQP